jgi:hypothetical protein
MIHVQTVGSAVRSQAARVISGPCSVSSDERNGESSGKFKRDASCTILSFGIVR